MLALLLAGAAANDTSPVPNDPLISRQYHLRRVRAFDGWTEARGKTQIIAVLDTGVDDEHPDLKGRVVEGIDLVDPDTKPRDRNGHGTFVAGIAVALAGNKEGGAGVAPRAKVMPVRVLDDEGFGTSDVVADGIRWATRNGADVINLSLADVPGQEQAPTSLITTDVELEIRRAALEGVVVVAAAGNDGAEETPYSRNLPALIVGASDSEDRVWKHSNRDDDTLFAPGVKMVSTYVGDPYAIADGTSFATPVVAAGAALLLQEGLDADEVREKLIDTARPLGAGVGRVDVGAALGVARPQRRAPEATPEPPEAPPSDNPAEPAPVGQPSPVEPEPIPASEVPPVQPAEPQQEPTVAAEGQPPPVTDAPVGEQPSPLAPEVAPSETALAAGGDGASSGTPAWVYFAGGGAICFIALFLGAYLTDRRSRAR